MSDKTVKDAYMEVVENQLQTGDPPATKATLERLKAAGHSEGDALRLLAAAARNEMQAMMAAGREFDTARYAKLLEKLPEID